MCAVVQDYLARQVARAPPARAGEGGVGAGAARVCRTLCRVAIGGCSASNCSAPAALCAAAVAAPGTPRQRTGSPGDTTLAFSLSTVDISLFIRQNSRSLFDRISISVVRYRSPPSEKLRVACRAAVLAPPFYVARVRSKGSDANWNDEWTREASRSNKGNAG